MTDGGAPVRLPPRPPRLLVMHWAVDTAVAFVALIVVASFFGAPIVGIAIVAAVIGVFAAPFTRRAEARALAAREADASRGPETTDDPTAGVE